MSMKRRQLAVLVVAGLLCSLAASPATAGRALELEPSGAIRGILGEGQRLFIGFARIRIRCDVVVTGQLNARITKIRDQSVGRIERVDITGCTVEPMGEVTVRTLLLPWFLSYQSFTGTLPNITSIGLTIPNAQFLTTYRLFGATITCLFQATTPVGIEAPGATASEFFVSASLNQNREAELHEALCGTERPTIQATWELQPAQRVRLVA